MFLMNTTTKALLPGSRQHILPQSYNLQLYHTTYILPTLVHVCIVVFKPTSFTVSLHQWRYASSTTAYIVLIIYFLVVTILLVSSWCLLSNNLVSYYASYDLRVLAFNHSFIFKYAIYMFLCVSKGGCHCCGCFCYLSYCRWGDKTL